MLSLSSEAPDDHADGRAYARYFSGRQFPRQGRVILFALAAELYENFNPAEAHGFLRQLGMRIGSQTPLPAVVTIDELQDTINAALADLDWGYVTMTAEESAMVIRQCAFPGHGTDDGASATWRRAFAAILEGVYVVWLREQGGGGALDVRVKDDTAVDVLELTYAG
jgi:hypothetical protein